ncbi:ricin-like [Ricinus communis]|uniref:ricin-like n=1 Tax=Ricinus communis TaxID=3988 RepID=UPI00201B065E|nr:ricin-like [Ricinus communis]
MPDIDDEVVCQIPKPTVRISGRNGLCIHIRDGKYRNRNPIQLAPGRFRRNLMQSWTLYKETIQSNDMCMTAYGFAPGNYVMIYDCRKVVPEATRWKIWANGTITNSKLRYALAASAGDKGMKLTLEENQLAASQAWLPSNSTDPLAASIIGLQDLCLRAGGNKV